MNIRLPENDWGDQLVKEWEQPYMAELLQHLELRYGTSEVYPPQEDLFHALRSTSLAEAKVVILGQDPYHGAGQAHGLSFSVRRGVKIPPSLRNMYKELEEDLGVPQAGHGCLDHWANQGVLLLNTVLTVEEGKPGSHQGFGWELFTDRIISLLNEREMPLIFLLWGKHAQEKAKGIDGNKHLVVSTAHPSPLAARKGFFGSKPFSKANDFLTANGLEPIDWRLPD
ncbi:uracil-DNA glycosylase [Paenibacillus soyae]|uniref:Uracil-DNA glycosylase n=1 Tax=Paenibacillus soyae TaxID=2969249 RepID=A0A9X2S827_9BACL|nr:uracil-DNA glycosylase [Paenibacillus soyae]MCR2803646.1 uracil-DNA glycosylase [Paenibacillus soyae]